MPAVYRMHKYFVLFTRIQLNYVVSVWLKLLDAYNVTSVQELHNNYTHIIMFNSVQVHLMFETVL